MAVMKTTIAVLLPILLLAACKDEGVTRVRVPKEPAVAADPHAGHDHGSAPESMPGGMGMGGGMGAGSIEAPAERPRGLSWTLPSGWKELPGNGIRLATLVPPGGVKAEGTVVALPGDSGGELANANRWRGQIGLPPVDEAGLAGSRTKLSTKAGPVAVYDFTSGGEARTRLIAAIVKTGDTTWFFKLTGDAAATESARPGFLAVLKGLTPDAAK